MAIYRSDQAQVTFSTESAQGGYLECASSVTDSGDAACTLDGAHEAGVTKLTVASLTSQEATDILNKYIQIGPEVSGSGTTRESEIRKVVHVDSTTTLHLDAPTGFYHETGKNIQTVSAVTSVSTDVYIDQIPGVYDTIDCPDPEMTIEPRYFLGSQSKRNFYSAYKGIQNFVGSIGGFILLNGRALRYPIGKVVTHTTQQAAFSTATLLAAAAKKGDVYVNIDSASTLGIAANELLVFDYTASPVSTSKMEIRKVISGAVSSGTTATLKLDYPLQFAHDDNTVLRKVTSSPKYTHHIFETVDLDTVTWHVHMRDSSETSTNDFDRRYYGGMIGSASLSADEGGMLNMSWDGVNFMGMVHNQATSTFSGRQVDSAGNAIGALATPMSTLMQTIDSDDVSFPTDDPYFFSQGSVTIFGQEVARIRSFSLTVSNGEEPRYYVTRRHGNRGPSEIRENRREYTCGMTLALPDSQATDATGTTLFKELLLEGNYGEGMEGFNITLTFTRGTDDTITINIPDDSDAERGGNSQGAFIRSAAHNITGDNPVQVDADILFRNIKIEIQDELYYYP